MTGFEPVTYARDVHCSAGLNYIQNLCHKFALDFFAMLVYSILVYFASRKKKESIPCLDRGYCVYLLVVAVAVVRVVLDAR